VAADCAPRFELIVGLHDVAERPDARGDELSSWVPFSEAEPVLDALVARCRQTGVRLRITSDDGFRSDYERLTPWLLDRGLTGTFFVPSRFIDRSGRLSASDLRELVSLGMDIGVHGARHVNWATMPAAEFAEDVREGRAALEQIIGRAVDMVALPFGGFNARVLDHLVAEGFSEIHTSRSGLALSAVALKPRNMIKPGNVEAVLALGHRRGGWSDAARCRLRRLATGLKSRIARS